MQNTSRDGRLQRGAVHTPESVVVRSVEGVSSEKASTKWCEASLLEKVVERGTMLNALRRVERNRGAAGIDGMKVAELRAWYMLHEEELRRSILEETYRPEPVRRESIPKARTGRVYAY
jgi:RNA-directed DNA polymerase